MTPRFKKIKRAVGLTLTEFIMASAITTIAIATIYSIYASGNDIWETKRYEIDMKAQARLISNAMARELKKTTRSSPSNPDNLTLLSSKKIKFRLPTVDGSGNVIVVNEDIVWDDTKNYEYELDSDTDILTRFDGTDTVVLGRNISSIEFIDASVDSSLYNWELKIIMTISKTTPRQRTLSYTFTSLIGLRN